MLGCVCGGRTAYRGHEGRRNKGEEYFKIKCVYTKGTAHSYKPEQACQPISVNEKRPPPASLYYYGSKPTGPAIIMI